MRAFARADRRVAKLLTIELQCIAGLGGGLRVEGFVNAAVVAEKNHDRVLPLPKTVEAAEQLADGLIKRLDGGEVARVVEAGFGRALGSMLRHSFLRGDDGSMNRVVREVSEPRLLAMLLDERQRLLREPAHAFVAGLVVVWFGRCGREVEPVVRRGVLLERDVAAIARVGEMPFADARRRVTGSLKSLREGERFTWQRFHEGRFGESRPWVTIPTDHVPHAVARSVLAGKQRGACGRALRHHVGVGETHSLARKPVEIRSGNELVSVATKRGPALVVGEDDDDVGVTSGCLRCATALLRCVSGVQRGQRREQQGGEE